MGILGYLRFHGIKENFRHLGTPTPIDTQKVFLLW